MLGSGISYLQLARMLEDGLQKRFKAWRHGRTCLRLSEAVGRPQLEQHVLLGFSQDPSSCSFLEPNQARRWVVCVPSAQDGRDRLRAEGLPAALSGGGFASLQ